MKQCDLNNMCTSYYIKALIAFPIDFMNVYSKHLIYANKFGGLKLFRIRCEQP